SADAAASSWLPAVDVGVTTRANETLPCDRSRGVVGGGAALTVGLEGRSGRCCTQTAPPCLGRSSADHGKQRRENPSTARGYCGQGWRLRSVCDGKGVLSLPTFLHPLLAP